MRFPLLALALLSAGCAAADEATPIESPVIVRAFPRGDVDGVAFGGLSGLAWDLRNKALIAVSDRGGVFEMPTSAEGPPRGLGKVRPPRRANDPEALLWLPEGQWIVAFEGGGALGYYRGDASALTESPYDALRHKAWRALPENRRIEALARLDFGRLLVIAEGGHGPTRRAWIVDGGRTVERRYAVQAGFEPVDAVSLPNGDVFVLERRFNGLLPPFFSSRISMIPADQLENGDVPINIAAVPLDAVLPSENWEGIAIAGETVWLVSDDNFRWPQRGLLAQLPLAYLRGLFIRPTP